MAIAGQQTQKNLDEWIDELEEIVTSDVGAGLTALPRDEAQEARYEEWYNSGYLPEEAAPLVLVENAAANAVARRKVGVLTINAKAADAAELGKAGFAGFTSFDDCVSSVGGDVADPDAYCATILEATKGNETEWAVIRPLESWKNGRILTSFISSEVVDKQQEKVPLQTIVPAMTWMAINGFYEYMHEGIPIGKILAWRLRVDPKDQKLKPEIQVGIYSKDWPPYTDPALGEMFDKAWGEMQHVGTDAESSIRGTWDSEIECDDSMCYKVVKAMGLLATGWVGMSPGGANPDADVTDVSDAKTLALIKAKTAAVDTAEGLIAEAYVMCLEQVGPDGDVKEFMTKCIKEGLGEVGVEILGDLEGLVDELIKEFPPQGTEGKMSKDTRLELITRFGEFGVEQCELAAEEMGVPDDNFEMWVTNCLETGGFPEKQLDQPSFEAEEACKRDVMGSDPTLTDEEAAELCFRMYRDETPEFEAAYGKQEFGTEAVERCVRAMLEAGLTEDEALRQCEQFGSVIRGLSEPAPAKQLVEDEVLERLFQNCQSQGATDMEDCMLFALGEEAQTFTFDLSVDEMNSAITSFLAGKSKFDPSLPENEDRITECIRWYTRFDMSPDDALQRCADELDFTGGDVFLPTEFQSDTASRKQGPAAQSFCEQAWENGDLAAFGVTSFPAEGTPEYDDAWAFCLENAGPIGLSAGTDGKITLDEAFASCEDLEDFDAIANCMTEQGLDRFEVRAYLRERAGISPLEQSAPTGEKQGLLNAVEVLAECNDAFFKNGLDALGDPTVEWMWQCALLGENAAVNDAANRGNIVGDTFV